MSVKIAGLMTMKIDTLGPWCAKLASNCSRRLLGLVCRPLRAARWAAQLSRPSWVVFALPSVSGGSGTVEGLSSAVDSHPVRLSAAGVLSLPFWYLRASYGRFERRQWRLVSSLVGDRFKGRTPSGG